MMDWTTKWEGVKGSIMKNLKISLTLNDLKDIYAVTLVRKIPLKYTGTIG